MRFLIAWTFDLAVAHNEVLSVIPSTIELLAVGDSRNPMSGYRLVI